MAGQYAGYGRRKVPGRQTVLHFTRNSGGSKTGPGSIPAPNPDPRPPNEVQMPSVDATAGASGGVEQTNYTGQASNQGPTDPRDANYWADVAKLREIASRQKQELDLEETYSNTNYNEALAQLARQEPRDTQNYREAQNKAGAFFSSRTTEGMGRLAQDYLLKRTQTERSQQHEQSAREIARAAIESGLSLDEAASLAAATERQTQRELDRQSQDLYAWQLAMEQAMMESESQGDLPSGDEYFDDGGSGGGGGGGKKKKKKK